MRISTNYLASLTEATDVKNKTELFNELILKMELTQSQLARWMSQENTKSARESIRKKLKGINGVTKTDIGLLRAVEYLYDLGYDVANVEFNENLEISSPLKLRK